MTSVSVTQQYKTVTVTEGDGQTSVVSAPSSTITVETVGLGPQGPAGPPGPSSLPPEVRVDAATAGTIYAGQAANGSAEASAVWTLTRTTYSAAGVRLTKGTATGVTWTGRAGHTYT